MILEQRNIKTLLNEKLISILDNDNELIDDDLELINPSNVSNDIKWQQRCIQMESKYQMLQQYATNLSQQHKDEIKSIKRKIYEKELQVLGKTQELNNNNNDQGYKLLQQNIPPLLPTVYNDQSINQK